MGTATAAAIAFIREADAAISPQAIESEYRLWFAQQFPGVAPNNQNVDTAVAWGQHLLSRGRRTRQN